MDYSYQQLSVEEITERYVIATTNYENAEKVLMPVSRSFIDLTHAHLLFKAIDSVDIESKNRIACELRDIIENRKEALKLLNTGKVMNGFYKDDGRHLYPIEKLTELVRLINLSMKPEIKREIEPDCHHRRSFSKYDYE